MKQKIKKEDFVNKMMSNLKNKDSEEIWEAIYDVAESTYKSLQQDFFVETNFDKISKKFSVFRSVPELIKTNEELLQYRKVAINYFCDTNEVVGSGINIVLFTVPMTSKILMIKEVI